MADDARHSRVEPRYPAPGHEDDGRLLLAMFAVRAEGRLPRVISVRDMSRKERMRHAEEG